MVYSGYAHFDSDEFSGWIGESGQKKDPAQYGLARDSCAAPGRACIEVRSQRVQNKRRPGDASALRHADRLVREGGPAPPALRRDDLRRCRARLDPLPPPEVPRAEVIDELYGAIVEGRRAAAQR